MLIRFVSETRRLLIDALFPPRCPLCDSFVARGGLPCKACVTMLHPLEGNAHLTLNCAVKIARCRSCFAYDGRIRDTLHGFKYGERLDLLRYLTDELVIEARSLSAADLIIPVPLHTKRLRERGFNQSALLALKLGEKMAIPVDVDSLKRVRDIPPQVGMERAARLLNVKGAFAVDSGCMSQIAGKSILLVDDVLTTGATINACAGALLAAKAARVEAVTVARAL